MAISSLLQQVSTRQGLHRYLLAAFSGWLVPLSFAPFQFWYITPLAICILMFAIQGRNISQERNHSGFVVGWFFGLGLFGNGSSWVYISIHDFGFTGMPLALLLTLAFVMGLSLLPAIQVAIFQRLFNHISPVWCFPALWVVFEWLRSWLLTGFPWLYLGNSVVDSPLSSWLPTGGVYLASFILVMAGVMLNRFIQQRLKLRTLVAFIVVVFAGAHLLNSVQWTQTSRKQPLQVALVQGNIDQNQKWQPQYRDEFLQLYLNLSQDIKNADLILWPETAVPLLVSQSKAYLNRVIDDLPENTALITGLPERATPASIKPAQYYNSVLVWGDGDGIYRKQKLVPFGEYVPLETMLRGAIDFFNLPMSSFVRGDDNQPPLQAKGLNIAPFICYEVVYPEFVRQQAKESDLMITISNDSWFGRSVGPLQHLQMAQVRAAENGRYMLRGTNNGVTAIIDPQGRIKATAPQFEQAIVRGEVWSMNGHTLYAQYGSLPLLAFCGLILLIQLIQNHRVKRSRIFSL